MNGPHDLGGQMGFGRVAPEPDEPYFHAEWEKRALGVVLSCGAFGAWTIDESRHARENIPPPAYLAASYYEIWIRALEVLLDRHGFVSPDEIAAGHKLTEPATPKRILKAAHSFNLLDARKAISVTERQRYILRIRTLTKAVAEAYYASREALGFPMCQRGNNEQQG